MTLVGLDDTDSRERGMCTTYVASRIAAHLRDRGRVERLLLIRLNPAIEHKTRGNASIAIHTDVDPGDAFDVASDVLDDLAIVDDDRTNPGLVVTDRPVPGAPTDASSIDPAVASFTRRAIRERLTIDDVRRRLDAPGYDYSAWGNGRGLIGALAAIGAWDALDEWTVEHIAYRTPDRWGTVRDVDPASLRTAADGAYPDVWDTIDRGTDELVAVPRTPGPVLVGIRGDDADAVDAVIDQLDGEPIATSQRFLTNQGTDVHLQDGSLGDLRDGRAYAVDGIVATEPETRRGGHVFVTIADEPVDGEETTDDRSEPDPGAAVGGNRQECVAFEPTKRFRDRVRALRPGDRITACGEVGRGTLKLEKFAVRTLRRTERATPTCPSCDRTMESAGSDQGYRCRDCGTTRARRDQVPIERSLEEGWYEVPPRARRHVAKPLVRGGFDAQTHPER
ncbi:tRNA(Ile)(2)-agmatinylcytidine synthase [Halovivax cerinus]|uniref:tRNA(Ile2) 2-agmatinylcytidine synthetase TiaS n=1 Tax=Halovivax cerinus TaxID=1487865 RepID=A0ABD5NNK8_9EURY|nr:tRNA(Ile)(2)-agmatinylcytidine synthase [Halovivax cerinus]